MTAPTTPSGPGPIVAGLQAAGRFVRLEVEDRAAGRRLRLVQDRRDRIGPRDILLVTCVGDEAARMPAFAAHYRALGVGHFLVVDTGGSAELTSWAAVQPDLSLWRAEARAALAPRWRNDLLRRHGRGRWCLAVEPDEFLVYPYMQIRRLPALTQFLEDDWRICMHAVVIDAYSDRAPAETVLEPGADPFALCPFFDRDGYVQSPGWGNVTRVQGGPHLRTHFRDWPAEAPELNRIPLIRWQRHFHYRSPREAWPRRLNRAHAEGQVSLTGALFRFAHVAGREPAADRVAGTAVHVPGISTRYRDPGQLVELGLMSPGRWF